MKRTMLVKLLFAVVGVCLVCSGALASYPEKPVVNIVSWAAGGTTDISQRLLGSFMPKYLGQPFVIENQAGGAAVPGTTAIARSAPDGYTVGVNWGASFTLRPFVLDVPYTVEDFTFIIGFLNQRNAIFVRNDSPFKTLTDLVEYAKAHPGELNYGAGAAASYQHLVAAAFTYKAGIEAEMIPYDGSRPSVVALLGGNLDYCVVEPGNAVSEMKSGTVRCLAVFEHERLAMWPDVPTALECRVDVVFPHTQFILGPAGMPKEAVVKLHDAIKAALEDPEFLKMAANAGLEIEYKSGEQVRQEIVDSIERLRPIIKEIF